ncbi:hypothetical protein HAX54_032694, partial [Datura stramonium]|nr:hypothetical protein [Datura stramonium]
SPLGGRSFGFKEISYLTKGRDQSLGVVMSCYVGCGLEGSIISKDTPVSDPMSHLVGQRLVRIVASLGQFFRFFSKASFGKIPYSRDLSDVILGMFGDILRVLDLNLNLFFLSQTEWFHEGVLRFKEDFRSGFLYIVYAGLQQGYSSILVSQNVSNKNLI